MTYYPPISPYAAGMGCKCPRCGQGRLFERYLTLAASCEACQLDYSKADSGDGPAVFLIFIVGFVSIVTVFVLRFGLDTPAWFALGAAIILASAMILLSLRLLKALTYALQFAHQAQEAEFEKRDSTEETQ